jgi:DNA-binding Lrp family transcriptional regulator
MRSRDSLSSLPRRAQHDLDPRREYVAGSLRSAERADWGGGSGDRLSAVAKAADGWVTFIGRCKMTVGGFDYLLEIGSPSMADLRRFLGTRLVTLPGLQQTHTYYVMEQVKSQSCLNLKGPAAVAGSTTRSNVRKRARSPQPLR